MIMTKDIAKAYAAELQYYNDKDTHHSNTLDILDYIKPCGYNTYDEYYSDVQEYMLRTLNYEIVEEPYIDPNMPIPYIQQRQPAYLYTINCDTNYAFVRNDFDKDDILKNYNYTICRLGYEFSHGPIISEDGDLRIYLIYPIQIELDVNYFLNKFKDYLLNYYDNVVVDNNDIMINNKKVCGSVMLNLNQMNILLMQVNFTDKTKIVEEICGISDKMPGYINPSILSAENLNNEFMSWLRL